MNAIVRRIARALTSLCAMAFVALPVAAPAAPLTGERQIVLQARDGSEHPIGTVRFTPEGDSTRFAVSMDPHRLKDFFLSMREFKCLEGSSEIFCHVPYPYAQPGRVTAGNLAWLEHALLFFFKAPRDFGARLWNGVYFTLVAEGDSLVGRPDAVDLNQIGAPPADLSVPPYPPAERSPIPEGVRWFHRLIIR